MIYKNSGVTRNYYNIICQNCGEKGHHVKECINPKTSLGMVIYKKTCDEIQYLMICRRNTIGFVEFIRGKYVYSDVQYLGNLFNVMTDKEIELIKSENFDNLWEYLWMDNKFNNKGNGRLKKNLNSASEKFNKIKHGYKVGNITVSIDYLIKCKTKFYKEQEWGFPKGRRIHNENDITTALREFNEETQIDEKDIRILSNMKRFIEEYKSYDNVCYKNVYYLAEYTGNSEIKINENDKSQYSEVSNIGFYNLKNAKNNIRDYNKDKMDVLDDINSYLESL